MSQHQKQIVTTLSAAVHNQQSLISGATVKLMLLHDLYVNGKLIAEGHFVYGTCKLSGERLLIDITAIQAGNMVFPVSLAAYDLDGIQGIYAPGALARDVAKQSSNHALQDLELNAVVLSIELQAASAGVETLKTFISKKTRLIKVSSGLDIGFC